MFNIVLRTSLQKVRDNNDLCKFDLCKVESNYLTEK